jgi:hypothetical protein
LTRAVELSCSVASCSWSILSTDVSVLVELVWIPAFFKKRWLPLPWEPCPGGPRGPCKQYQH